MKDKTQTIDFDKINSNNAFGKKSMSVLVIIGIFITMAFPIVHYTLRQFNFHPELADKTVFILLIVITGLFLIYSYFGVPLIEKILNANILPLLGILLLILLFSSVSTITVLPGAEGKLWFGYGLKISIVGLLAIPIVFILYYSLNKKLHLVLSIVTCFLVAPCYLISVFQPPWGVIDFGHTLYVVNELLGPQNGMYPLVNFCSQYTFLLGYIFNIFFNSNGDVNQAIWFLTVLSLCTISIFLLPFIINLPKHKRYLAILFMIPAIFIVKPNEDFYSGSISLLFSALPVRTLFPGIIAALLSFNISNRLFGIIVMGFVCALGALNNFESGIVSLIATVVVLLVVNGKVCRNKKLYLFIGSIIFFFCIFLVVIYLFFGDVRPQLLTVYSKGFGSGYGSIPMPIFGLWVFFYLSISVVIPTLYLKRFLLKDIKTRNFGILALFWSLFGLGMLPYYINRSVVSGQLQLILIAMFISSAALFYFISAICDFKKNILFALFFILPVAISMASLTQYPSPVKAISRLKFNSKKLPSSRLENEVLKYRQSILFAKKFRQASIHFF